MLGAAKRATDQDGEAPPHSAEGPTTVHRLIARVRTVFERGKPDEADPAGAGPQHNWRSRLHAWWEGYYLDSGIEPQPGAENTPAGAVAKSSAGPAAAPAPNDQWSEGRIKVAELVWGDGFSFPGGAEHVLHLVKPLGLNKDKTLLDFGCGLGGATRAIAKEFGAWVRGFEGSKALAQAGMKASEKAGLAKRATIEHFDPDKLNLPPAKFDAAFVRAAFWWMPDKQRFLGEVVKALKPHGMIMLTDFVLAQPGQCSPVLGAWIDAERRGALPCTLEEINAEFAKLKIDVRISEDISAEFKRQVVDGWTNLGAILAAHTLEPGESGALAREIDMWKSCLACLSSGELGMARVLGIKAG
jgi:cyclopropane fatty-acyl-phospholipid synthase-like methyltransferase